MRLQIQNALTKELRFHPATTAHGTKGSIGPLSWADVREFTLPSDDLYPWLKLWNHETYVNLLISPTSKNPNILPATFFQVFNDTGKTMYLAPEMFQDGFVGEQGPIHKYELRTINFPKDRVPKILLYDKGGAIWLSGELI